MAVTYVASAHAGNNTTAVTSLSVNKPAGTVSGDVMLALGCAGASNGLTSSGWTQTGTTIVIGSDMDSKVFYKVAGGSEPSTYSWTVTASDNYVVSISTFRGVDNAAPINAIAQATNVTTQNVTTPSVTSTATGLTLYLRHVRDDVNSSQTISVNGSVVPLADTFEFHIASPTVNGVVGLAYNSANTAAGSQSGVQLNYSATPIIGSVARSLSLKAGAVATTAKTRPTFNQAINRAGSY